MSTDLIDPPTQPIPRDRYGRPLVVPPGGGNPVPYTRCTTYVDCLDDTYNLGRWQQRNVAIGLAQRPDLLIAVAATDRGDKEALNKLTEQAQEAAQAHAAATTGTALHSFTERHDRGSNPGPVPAAYQPDIAAYVAATDPLETVAIERFCVCDELQVGGTADRVVLYQGRAYIADLKTGSIEWGQAKIAMQLAMYAHSVPYEHTTATRGLYPVDVDLFRGIVVHLPAGTGRCALYWVDLEAGWAGVQLAGQVRQWRSRRGYLDPWAPAAETAGDSLNGALAAVAQATTVDALYAAYNRAVAAGVPADALLPACKARKAELVAP